MLVVSYPSHSSFPCHHCQRLRPHFSSGPRVPKSLSWRHVSLRRVMAPYMEGHEARSAVLQAAPSRFSCRQTQRDDPEAFGQPGATFRVSPPTDDNMCLRNMLVLSDSLEPRAHQERAIRKWPIAEVRSRPCVSLCASSAHPQRFVYKSGTPVGFFNLNLSTSRWTFPQGTSPLPGAETWTSYSSYAACKRKCGSCARPQ